MCRTVPLEWGDTWPGPIWMALLSGVFAWSIPEIWRLMPSSQSNTDWKRKKMLVFSYQKLRWLSNWSSCNRLNGSATGTGLLNNEYFSNQCWLFKWNLSSSQDAVFSWGSTRVFKLFVPQQYSKNHNIAPNKLHKWCDVSVKYGL